MPTKTKRKPKTLAHVKKLSTLLAIGLRDLRKQERAKNSVVDMDVCLKQNGECVACLAGSVMRFSLDNHKPRAFLDDESHDLETQSRLRALDKIRLGYVRTASECMGVITQLPFRTIETPKYDGPNGEWWAAMKSLLKELREAGE
jgi:hypothetical protein